MAIGPHGFPKVLLEMSKDMRERCITSLTSDVTMRENNSKKWTPHKHRDEDEGKK